MGQQYLELSDNHIEFIKEQKIYFVGTATAESKINISPKGMDSLRVLNCKRVIWLNITGSGNETAAHVQEDARMTIMFAAFEGKPLILRLYGKAKVIHKKDKEWEELITFFNPLPGARQILDLSIELVQSSCGMGVPYFDYVNERNMLDKWAEKQGDEGIKEYWSKKNQLSLDGKPTNILQKNI